MEKYLAEFIGTFTLVLFGCGTAVVAGGSVGVLGIAFAFGLALIAMAYGIGPISGCHINPAVTLGAWVAGRTKGRDVPFYIVAQVLGAIVAASVLMVILNGHIIGGKVGAYDVAKNGLGHNGWGTDYGGEYNLMAAATFEFVATFLFVLVILGSTSDKAPAGFAGLAIGLTLVVIHIFGINITGVSVNPARSIGPALLVGGMALKQVWLFIVAPIAGALAAGVLFNPKLLVETGDQQQPAPPASN